MEKTERRWYSVAIKNLKNSPFGISIVLMMGAYKTLSTFHTTATHGTRNNGREF